MPASVVLTVDYMPKSRGGHWNVSVLRAPQCLHVLCNPTQESKEGCFPYLQVSAPSSFVMITCNIKACDTKLLIVV